MVASVVQRVTEGGGRPEEGPSHVCFPRRQEERGGAGRCFPGLGEVEQWGQGAGCGCGGRMAVRPVGVGR